MPNHVTNELIFREVSHIDQGRILAAIQNDEGKIDFELLVPAPLNMWFGSVGVRHEKAFRRTHLDWARDNWGTKWNAYGAHIVEPGEATLRVVFDTAWGPPYPWLAAVFNSFKVSFDHNWVSEGESRGRHDVFDYSKIENPGGQPWTESAASDDLHKHLHVLRWGVESFDDEDE